MHEYSIAYDIFATARRAAIENKASGIKAVRVDIGEMAMVNPEQVKFLFDAIVEDDPLFAGVRMECRKVPVRTTCECGYEGGERFVCPSCGGLPHIVEGKEIVVSSIEIEVNES
ncbi:hydrogenase maturation nickel metallochaperone HypA/HybF [Methanofollis fontis]|uniref:Hydrogenase maturation factor HypA n=1 Tax=Methanofollis fontis TaxID=2052832 RepID=A0A483CYK0_9EURY|nr:hydrogenase maturation nickel metallochaperone HypA [Methanofollis fontis]TAJ44756.1 hydrogenase expression protein [Methanofollis fontis]